MKTLSELIDICKDMHLPVTDICDDSRKATPGCLFIAIKGIVDDGTKYISDAIANGAKYILLNSKDSTYYYEWKSTNSNTEKILFIYVKNTRIELANIAARFFETNKIPNTCNIISVTGTNGKSSTVDIVRQIWIKNHRNAASIGTLGIISNHSVHNSQISHHLTSPGTIELHKTLQKLLRTGINNIAIEASSHGIAQDRISEIPFSICAFTNFSHDHLDYHKTIENYWKAKEKLFSIIAGNQSIFVVNSDCEYSEEIQKIAKERGIRCTSYGYKDGSDVQIISITPKRNHQRITILFFGDRISFSLPLYGRFQAYNSICAALICYFSGIKLDNIISALEKINPINGRLELVSEFNKAKIYIDYAHTPDALKNALLAIREHNPAGIITLFGCGGERDAEKRSIMGKIADKYSDIVIVTDDNPRNEDAAKIRQMIMAGCSDAIEIANRKRAIEYGMDILTNDYVLLIAGKGHENYQIIQNETVQFSDKNIILNKVLK